MVLIDRGRAVAGLCFVENLIDAALLALDHEHAPGQAFNVTDGLDVTWRQFTDGLADGLGCSQGALEHALLAGRAASASHSSTATALLRTRPRG